MRKLLMTHKADVIFIGAGLANTLIALEFIKIPGIKVLFIDSRPSFDIQKTWSFFLSDILRLQKKYPSQKINECLGLFERLKSQSWAQYEVRFNNFNRKIEQPYFSIAAQNYYDYCLSVFGDSSFLWNQKVNSVTANEVYLESGTQLKAQYIFDSRAVPKKFGPCGYQKFVGLEYVLKKSSQLQNPIIMDVDIDQKNEFRFMYSLNFNNKSILIEDTRYSNTAVIDAKEYEKEIHSYAQKLKLDIGEIIHREQAALQIPLTLNYTKQWQESKCFLSGVAAGFFHPTTGYSLPYALEYSLLLAEWICRSAGDKLVLREAVDIFCREQFQKFEFFILLNRMLFGACKGSDRHQIFSRFYQLSDQLISRFYASDLHIFDQMRLLMGRPPVSVISAMNAIACDDWLGEFNPNGITNYKLDK